MSYWFLNELASLKALLGANGVRTSALRDAHDVIDVANKLFGLAFDFGMDDEENLAIMLHQQAVIRGMPYADRRLLVRQKLGTLPAVLVSTAKANQPKREGWLAKRDRRRMDQLQGGEW